MITYNIEGGVVLGQTAKTATKFNIAVAASNHIEGGKYGSFKARIYSSDGQVKKIAPSGGYAVKNGTVHNIVKNAAGDPFEFDKISVEQTEAPVVELQGATSSTLSFKWTVNDKVDRDRPYTVALYKDEACSELLASWKIVANDGAYKTGDNYWHHTAFNFSGLAANTPYWCKVTDTENNLVSDAVAGTTADFTPVPVGAEVGEGETVLAEDFSELIWGGDMVYNSIGYIFNIKGEDDTTLPFPDTFTKSEGDTHDGYIKAGCTTDKSLFGDYRTAAGSTRLAAWAHITNNTSAGVHIYARPGHLKLSRGSVWTRLATPVLSNLRETATLTVKFKASPYYDHDQQSIADAFSACVSVLTNTGDRADNGTIAEYDELVAKEFTLVDAKNVWTEYEFDIPNVPKGARIAIGTNDKADGKHRMFIDDIEITVKAYETVKMPVVRLQGATSSTLSFQWSENGFTNAEEDIVPNYEVGLYTDEACTSDNLVVSWEISSGNASYYTGTSTSKTLPQPAFNFSGLDANTTYYCKVKDTDSGIESAPVSGTTKEFTVVTVGDDEVAVGGTVLAEDFSELVWNGDMVFPGISSKANDKYIKTIDKFIAAEGINPTDNYDLVNCGKEDQLFHPSGYYPKVKKTRLVDWAHLTNNTDEASDARVYARLGHVKLGTSDWARIATPVLKNLKETATVEVSFKASPYYDNNNTVDSKRTACVTVLHGASSPNKAGKITAKDEYTAYTVELTDAKNTWTEYKCTVRNVTPESRIAIGATSETSSHRMYIDDIKITVVAYEADTAPVVELQGATTSTLSFKWTMNGDYDRDRPYKVALYDNSECGADNLVVSWNIPVDDGTSDSVYRTNKAKTLHPTAFNFSGLTANTPYWCKVTDLSNGAVSAVVSGTTNDFKPATIDKDVKIEKDGVVLAEDFSELIWNGDAVYNGISYTKTSVGSSFTKATGNNPSGYKLVGRTNDSQIFTIYKNHVSTTRLSNWGYRNQPMYGRLGHLRLGNTTAPGWSRIVTPMLENLKGTATVKVSVKIAPFFDHDLLEKPEAKTEACIAIIDNGEYGTSNTGQVTVGNGTETIAVTFDVDQTKNVWTTYEYEISNVTPTSRIEIGATETDVQYHRMYIDEIVITVVSYNE